ncbi:hypothetical protein HanOQP8_Chr01g0006591 [Helianthus annuus]|nr:hypothetical protein HanOQP8_Chr01g0006591 [Helianthus annuus]
MAILRSLRQLARKTSYTRPFFISTPNPTSLRTLRSSIFLSRSSNLLSPSIPNFHGPLFLSYPPWKLLQLATPLYFQSDVVSVPKLRPLDFLPEPIKLATNLDHNKDSEIFGSRGGDGLVRSFVNWPNFISMSRLVSGPVLGWYDFLFIYYVCLWKSCLVKNRLGASRAVGYRLVINRD